MASVASVPVAWGTPSAPEIAFTFDDPTTDGGASLTWPEINKRILDTLTKRKVKTVLFVCGKRVDSNAGRELIAAWDRAGHNIANHSYSHLYFNVSAKTDSDTLKVITLPQYEADALKVEPLIRDYPHFVRLFRFPFFKEGDTVEKRDGMRSFLQDRGYRIGRATIDASDWAIDERLQKRTINHLRHRSQRVSGFLPPAYLGTRTILRLPGDARSRATRAAHAFATSQPAECAFLRRPYRNVHCPRMETGRRGMGIRRCDL